jgi:hypothetical protein
MKKQNLSLSFCLVFSLFTYLVSEPTKVNAGVAGAQGSAPDSSTSSGDNFNPVNLQPTIEFAPNISVFGSDNSLSVSNEVQNSLNNAFSTASASNGISADIKAILTSGAGAEAKASQLQSFIAGLGVSPSLAEALVKAILSLAETKSANASGVPVGELKPLVLVASAKGLVADSVIEKKGETANVNINKLNAAITAYNQIVMESSPEVLQKLAKDPEFVELGKLLKQLRVALKTG